MAKKKLWRDPVWLKGKYWGEGLTLAQVAAQAGCSAYIVRKWMARLDIPRRTRSEVAKARYDPTTPEGREGLQKHRESVKATYDPTTPEGAEKQLWRDPDWLKAKYEGEGLTIVQVAALAGCSANIVRKWMARLDIPRRTRSEVAKARYDPTTPEGREGLQKHREAVKATYDPTTPEGREGLQKHREAVKAAYNPTTPGERERLRRIKDAQKAHWECGAHDGRPKSPTSIETAVSDALDALGIEHEVQYRPDGYSRIYDELVPPDVLIEVQGDYWHNLPGVPERDAEKAAWARANGYHLVVIWGHEIREVGAPHLVRNRVIPLLPEKGNQLSREKGVKDAKVAVY